MSPAPGGECKRAAGVVGPFLGGPVVLPLSCAKFAWVADMPYFVWQVWGFGFLGDMPVVGVQSRGVVVFGLSGVTMSGARIQWDTDVR